MRKALSIALLGLITAAPVAQAGSWNASIGFVSDYRFRGISQTQGDPALQIGAQYAFDNGIYLGTWASNVDFVDGDGANTEVDLFVGFGTNLTEDFAVDAQLLHYFYPSSSAGVDYEYTEVIASLSWKGLITGTIGYSNDVFASGQTGIYYQLGSSHTVFDDYTISGSIGYYDLDDVYGGGYTDYSVGVSRAIGPLNVGLAWVSTNRNLDEFFGPNDGSRFVFSIGTSFPTSAE
jgi:uncharacterized protein (TIGR02001 family)